MAASPVAGLTNKSMIEKFKQLEKLAKRNDDDDGEGGPKFDWISPSSLFSPSSRPRKNAPPEQVTTTSRFFEYTINNFIIKGASELGSLKKKSYKKTFIEIF